MNSDGNGKSSTSRGRRTRLNNRNNRNNSSMSERPVRDMSLRDSRCAPFNPLSLGSMDYFSGEGMLDGSAELLGSPKPKQQMGSLIEIGKDDSSISLSLSDAEEKPKKTSNSLRHRFSAMLRGRNKTLKGSVNDNGINTLSQFGRGNKNVTRIPFPKNSVHGEVDVNDNDINTLSQFGRGNKNVTRIPFPKNSLHGKADVIRHLSNDGFDASHHSGASLFRNRARKAKQKKKKKKWYNPFTQQGSAYGSGSLQADNEEAFLMDSISWFGRHIPDCVLASFLHPVNKSNREPLSVGDPEGSNSYTKNDRSSCIMRELKQYKLPHATKHYSAILFVDISDTITDCEGDILKFAGDAVFAEWRGDSDSLDIEKSMQSAAIAACNCGAKIVQTCSDYPVFKSVGLSGEGEQVSTLNVHCGVGFGLITGVHVGDNEKRREFLVMGDPINQVAKAEAVAEHGEVMASPELIYLLEEVCWLDPSLQDLEIDTPGLIASRKKVFFKKRLEKSVSDLSTSTLGSVQYFQRIHDRLEGLSAAALKEIRRNLSTYVHPISRNDEMHASHHPSSKRTTEERHRAEAELRTVYVIFVNVEIELDDVSDETILYEQLNNVLNTASEVLDEHKGHLRQFIVDDKGVVLIATFGLRGSTSLNMVKENALPATLKLHRLLIERHNVRNKIGATLGKAYCGVVGGVRRHEYAVLGPTVNLAARLMANKSNPGVLVDCNVQSEAGQGFEFCALPSVTAKGYDEPVPIFEPLQAVQRSWEKAKRGFIGRKNEMKQVLQIAKGIVFMPTGSQMILMTGDSGIGKSVFVSQAAERLKKVALMKKDRFIITRKVVKEVEKLAPFSAFRTIFFDILETFEEKPNDTNDVHLSISQHGFFAANGLDRSRHGLAMSLDTNRSRASAWVDHLATAEDLSSGASHTSSKGLRMSPLNRLHLICEELDQNQSLADIVAKYFLDIEVENMEEVKRLPQMTFIIQFMVDTFLHVVKDASLVVIALDDVHFMDALSWKTLQALFEQGKNLLFVCTSRPFSSVKNPIDEEFHSLLQQRKGKTFDLSEEGSFYWELELRPFDRNEVRHLIAVSNNYGEDNNVDESLSNFVYEQSGGMPHFAQEILNMIRIDGSSKLNKDQLLKGSTTFSSMERMMLHILDNLDREMRQTIQIMSVLGREFSTSDLVLVHKMCLGYKRSNDNDDYTFSMTKLKQAIDENIIEIAKFHSSSRNADTGEFEVDEQIEDNLYRFRLDVFRTSVINSMLGSRQRDLHSAIARVLKSELNKPEKKATVREKLALFIHLKASGDSVGTASLVLEIGKQFEMMGLSSQSLSLYNETLELWNVSAEDESGSDKETIGGVDSKMLYAIGPTDLEYLIRLKIESGKCFANIHDGLQSAKTYQSAYEILKESPASDELEDHAMLFPIFSGLCLALKWGRLKDNEARSYEQELVARFVLEAKRNGDPIHEARALAMQGVMFYNMGKLEQCLETHHTLDKVYDVRTHTKGICKAYGSDRAAQNYGLCAQWHELLGNTSDMIITIEFVLETLLPEMEERNVHNQFMLLYPILMVMKNQGTPQRALNLFENHVVNMFQLHYGSDASTFCLSMYKPTVYLLKLLAIENEETIIDATFVDEIIEWITEETVGEFKKDLESVTVNLGRDGTGAVAEICLLVATNNRICAQMSESQRKVVLHTGLKLAESSVERSKHNIGYQYAYKEVKPVLERLRQVISQSKKEQECKDYT